MVVRGVVAVIAATVLLLADAVPLAAQNLSDSRYISSTFDSTGIAHWMPQHYHSIGVKKFFNSFTSYQFPNPFPPQQDPLSRLEFPIDQWFLGVTGRYAAQSWTVHAEGWINLSRESQLKMQDSDWDDESRPSQKTIFSESKCRLNRGWILDVSLAHGTPMERYFPVRPVIGYRYQHFFFTTHDGEQAELADGSMDLPGDGIDFKQTFYHIYFGAVSNLTVNLDNMLNLFPRLALSIQFDYALVTARNEDLHLLRPGERVTVEKTRGHCWHLSATVELLARGSHRIFVEADFKRLLTDGSHELTNRLFNLDFSFNGSKVWSDQTSVSAMGEIAF